MAIAVVNRTAQGKTAMRVALLFCVSMALCFPVLADVLKVSAASQVSINQDNPDSNPQPVPDPDSIDPDNGLPSFPGRICFSRYNSVILPSLQGYPLQLASGRASVRAPPTHS